MEASKYYSLEATAARLNLPQSYIRQLAKEKKIPFLNVRGRLRFNPAAVQAALDRIAEVEAGCPANWKGVR